MLPFTTLLLLSASLLLMLWSTPTLAVSADQSYYSSMYYRPRPSRACIQRLSRTGAVGCTTPRDGQAGALLHFLDLDSLNTYLNTSLRSSAQGTSLVVASKLLDYPMYERILGHFETARRSGIHHKLAGIIVLHRTPQSTPFSTGDVDYDVDGDGVDYKPDRGTLTSREDPYPQKQLSLHSDSPYVWNPRGDGWLRKGAPPANNKSATRSFNVPIVAVWDKDVDRVLRAAKENVRLRGDGGYPGYMASFKYYMYGEATSVECLDKNTCMPVGGYSVWSSLFPLKTAAEKGAVLGLAGFDASSLLFNAGTGLESALSGVVALLGAAEALARAPRESLEALPRAILFAAFQGEDWGYAGSRRWAADLRTFKCKRPSRGGESCLDPYRIDSSFEDLPLSAISSTIEMKQVGLGTPGFLYAHVEHGHQASETLRQDLVNLAHSIPPDFPPGQITLADAHPETPGIPPSSTQSIIAEQRLVSSEAASNMGSVVITDHSGPYNNQYYGSTLDRLFTNDGRDEGFTQICAAATLFARSLYFAAAKGNAEVEALVSTVPAANCREIAELIKCFATDPRCPLLEKLGGSDYSERQITPVRNAGVFLPSIRANLYGEVTVFRQWFARVNAMHNTTKGSVHYHEAVDPAIEYNPDHKKFEFLPGLLEYDPNSGAPIPPEWPANVVHSPVWTESNWANDVGMVLYREENPIMQFKMLGIGLGVVLLTIVALWRSDAYCKARFGNPYEEVST